MPETGNLIVCALCGSAVKDNIAPHLTEVHSISVQEYLRGNPNAPIVSGRLWGRYLEQTKGVKRAKAPPVDQLTVDIKKIKFPFHANVPASACLPMPSHYAFPSTGNGLSPKVDQVLVSLYCKRSIFVWGLPGTGKDALFHAWSARTRTPAILRQIRPGTDVEAWFFCRGFNQQGTFWEEGDMLRALRDGFLTATGERIPYLVLISDLDRADSDQAEYLRLITDSIQGRIDGPGGRVYDVLPGSVIVATANTSGGGDERGRMVSAKPIDGSLMNRFERKYEFPYMDWADESKIIQAKFPGLLARAPSILKKMEVVTANLRDAIAKEELHGEFSHRDLCHILGAAEDIMRVSGRLDQKILKWASRTWIDGLPDSENRQKAANMMDPKLGVVDEGDTSHINPDPLKGRKK